MLKFAIKLIPHSDGTVRASFPDVPIAVAYGRTYMEAFRNARRALRDALTRYREAGFDLPVPRTAGPHLVRISL